MKTKSHKEAARELIDYDEIEAQAQVETYNFQNCFSEEKRNPLLGLGSGYDTF